VLSLIHWCTRALVAHGEMDHKVRVLERMPAPAQQIKRWTGQPLPLAARSAVRRMPDGSTRDHCRSGAETLPGVPRRRTYTVVVGPWCEGYWRRIGPYRPSHASRYSACLPPSCSAPFASSGGLVGNGDNTPNKREGSLSVPTPHQSPLRVKLRHPARLVWKVMCAPHRGAPAACPPPRAPRLSARRDRCAAVIGFGVLLLLP
jgi:hypothetical protein